jgi:hypothetical protein
MCGSIEGMTRNTIKPVTPSTTTVTKKPAQLIIRSNIKAGPMWAR